MGPSFEDIKQKGKVPVALLGRVPVYREGDVAVGDVMVAAGGGKVKRWKPGMKISGYAGLALGVEGDKVILLTGHQGLPKVIDALQDELKELRQKVENNALLDANGNAGLGTTAPAVKLEVRGGFALVPDGDVVLTESGQTVEVGNRSYIRLRVVQSRIVNRQVNQDNAGLDSVYTFRLSKGLSRGQLLVLEWIDAVNKGELLRGSEQSGGGITRLSANWPSSIQPHHSRLMLIFNGSDWLEVNRSAN